MSLKKLLTILEKIEFKYKIKEMYICYNNCNKARVVAMVIIAWIFEYFAGCIECGNNRTMGSLSGAVSRLFGDDVSALNNNISDIRHSFVHEPFRSIEPERVESILRYNTHETIQKFCSVFEEDAKEFELIYKDVMKTLGLYKAPETFDTKDVKYSKWDNSYLGIQG